LVVTGLLCAWAKPAVRAMAANRALAVNAFMAKSNRMFFKQNQHSAPGWQAQNALKTQVNP
jgi:hypothetical protein